LKVFVFTKIQSLKKILAADLQIHWEKKKSRNDREIIADNNPVCMGVNNG
jgi:hypothetical protein